MEKKTAVEWLCKELESYGDPQFCEIEWKQLDSLIKQAKEMEKKQHKKTWFDSTSQFDNAAEMTFKKYFDDYYNETYGDGKQ